MTYKKGEKLTNEESLLRRVFRADRRYIDKITGKPTSRAFTPRPKTDEGKLSVNIERLTTYESAILDSVRFILFSIPSSLPHSLGLECIYDPTEASGEVSENLAHALIIGFSEEDESVPGILARQAKIILYP